jgi:hypothetical protein
VRFDISDGRRHHRYWLVVSGGEHEVCVHDPGFGDDAIIITDPATLVRWHTGRITLGQAQGSGAMQVSGPRWMLRTLDAWGRFSPSAGVVPATR